jgi:cytochrome c oxidase cbb3-type subunit I/II
MVMKLRPNIHPQAKATPKTEKSTGGFRNEPTSPSARVGGKYPNVWHLRHMEDPRSISVGSNMPSFAWLLTRPLDTATLVRKIAVQRTLGAPYPNWTPEQIMARVDAQARAIAADLKTAGADVAPDKEIIALIAYLQQLGHFEAVSPALPGATK